MSLKKLFKKRRSIISSDIIEVRRSQKLIELELKQIEQTVAIARRRGPNR
jgi:hypothetical protein